MGFARAAETQPGLVGGKRSRRVPVPDYMDTYRWKPAKAQRMLQLRDKLLTAELSRLFGPPHTPTTPPPLGDFGEFAAAYRADGDHPPWPAPWEYAVAAGFQLARLLGDDPSEEAFQWLLFWAEEHGMVASTWRYTKACDAVEDWAKWCIDRVTPATALVQAKALLNAYLQLLLDLVACARAAEHSGYCPIPAPVRLLRSALVLAQLPDNWRRFEFGSLGGEFDGRKNELSCRVEPDPACVWLWQLANRHQAALAELGAAYLRTELARADVPDVEGPGNGHKPNPGGQATVR